ncbi:MAG: DUF3373 family protein [Helicobacteraceae bacterium]|nr:DUF3373 family protein [Helicobacteraceae bacterium]
MKIISIATASILLSANLIANDDLQKQIDTLTQELEEVKKKQDYSMKSISDIKKNTMGDNVKLGLEFRNAIDVLEYKDNTTGQKSDNDGLYTSRLYLNMIASPMKGLMFKGKLAIYSVWGAHLYETGSGPIKDWSASSKPSDTVMRLKEGYFVYSTKLGNQPLKISIGRRPASNGFLANMRENEESAGSPLAHITNMEVNGAMIKIDLSRFVEGAYTKLVYGRAHTGDMTNAYGTGNIQPWGPYATTDSEDRSVDFFVMPGDAYNNGQHQVMYQWAHIFNTKGENVSNSATAVDAGTADLFALSYKVSGLSEESEFLENTSLFASAAYSYYDAKDGYILNGSNIGSTSKGHSFWVGANIPDIITKSGKLGVEYNYGSKYWTPMTWAEDTAIGSKIAVRGSAYEAYWNFDLFGVKYLPSQFRYTYAQHNYTPNVNCAGWTPVEKTDITAQNMRFFVTYKY